MFAGSRLCRCSRTTGRQPSVVQSIDDEPISSCDSSYCLHSSTSVNKCSTYIHSTWFVESIERVICDSKQLAYCLNKLFFSHSCDASQVHMYCPDCQNYLGINVTIDSCAHCNCKITRDECMVQGTYMFVATDKASIARELQIWLHLNYCQYIKTSLTIHNSLPKMCFVWNDSLIRVEFVVQAPIPHGLEPRTLFRHLRV